MRLSQLFTTTLREAPRDSEGGNQELLVRAGFIRQLVSGVYSFLPLGVRTLSRITQIVHEEMQRAGGQEVIMPVLQPKELWEQRPAHGGPTRAEVYGEELFALEDRKGRALALGPTHEEVAIHLAAEFVRSYRDLPLLIYQIQTKFRDQFRPRGGLLRTREFLMKDLYSFDSDEEGMERSFQKMQDAYAAIFQRCGLYFHVVQADSGAIGGKASLEFFAPTAAGEDDAIVCESCHYAANREKAEFKRSELPEETEAALTEVHTPNCTSIRDLTAFLNIPESKTIKSVCYVAGGRSVLVVVRGDLEVNEIKLTNVLRQAGINGFDLHLAMPEELAKEGIIAGYTSPLNKGEHILIIADISLQQGNNFVAGANRVDYHSKHVNYPRDFRVDIWEDIASAYDGAVCAFCGGTLHAIRGSELGHIFKIGTRYSDLFGVSYLDAEGNARPILMCSYGIGISRLLAVAVEQSHDDKGMLWPFGIAPYSVALVGLDLEKAENRAIAEQLYANLTAAGIEVLYDDRAETAGVKFNDADLIGLPLRVVVSKRSLKKGGIEVKLRAQKEIRMVSLEDAVQAIQEEIRKGLHQDKIL